MTAPERREQLLGVARTLFAERGYEAASVEEVAERAGVSKPVVYQHFGGKEGLYAVVVDREVTELTARIAMAFEGQPTPREAGERGAAFFLGYIEEREEGFRILIRDAPVGSGVGTFAGVLSDVAVQVERYLRLEFRRQGLNPKVAPLYAQMLVGAVAMVGQWWLDVGKPSKDVVAGHVVNLMWNGLRGLEAKPGKVVVPVRASAETPGSVVDPTPLAEGT